MSALSEDLGELRRLNAQRFLTLAVGVWGMICAGSICKSKFSRGGIVVYDCGA